MNGSLIREVSKWIALKFRLRNRNFPYPDSWCGKMWQSVWGIGISETSLISHYNESFRCFFSWHPKRFETQFCKGRPPAPPSYPRLRPLFWQTVPQVPQDAWSCAIWSDGPTGCWCQLVRDETSMNNITQVKRVVESNCSVLLGMESGHLKAHWKYIETSGVLIPYLLV